LIRCGPLPSVIAVRRSGAFNYILRRPKGCNGRRAHHQPRKRGALLGCGSTRARRDATHSSAHVRETPAPGGVEGASRATSHSVREGGRMISSESRWKFGSDPPHGELLLLFLERAGSLDHGDPETTNEVTVTPGWVDCAGIHGLRTWQPDGAVRRSMQNDGWRVVGWRSTLSLLFEARRERKSSNDRLRLTT
jgi:hypothetical protein